MITIKINKKSLVVPTFAELTLRQYKDLLPFIAESGFIDVLRYICVTTGEDYKKSLRFKVTGIERLNKLLGTFLFIGGQEGIKMRNTFESAKPCEFFKFRKIIYDFRKFNPSAVGYRILYEQYLLSKPTDMELYIFSLAIMLTDDNFSYADAKEYYTELDDYNAYKVLTLGAFFFLKWKISVQKESRFLRMLKKILSMSIQMKENKLVVIDLRNLPQYQK